MRLLALACALLALLPAVAAAQDRPPPRLDTLAAQLREGPLAVDDDVVYLLSPDERRALVRDLRDAPVPFYVALLPALDEDESGGDQVRQVTGLYERVKRPGVYLVVDERGGIEFGSADVPVDITVDFSTAYGGSTLDEGEQPGSRTVAARVRQFIQIARDSERVAPEPWDTAGRADPELPELTPEDSDDFVPMAITFSVLAVLAGLVLWGLTVAAAAMLRNRRA